MESKVSMRSDCVYCKHFDIRNKKCPAFPKGVPFEIYSNNVKHREIRGDQYGTFVFEQSQWAIDNKFPTDIPTEGELRLKWEKEKKNTS